MSRVLNTETLFIDGPAGRLEAIYEHSAQHSPVGSVAVCHPHPQHGGTMQNKVAHTLSRAFIAREFSALRFNFRGVGKSEGVFDDGDGELMDVLAAVEFMRARFPGTAVWLGGFSFGAAMAVRAAVATDAAGLVSIAPAASRLSGNDSVPPSCPWLIVQGENDELVDIDDTIKWLNSLAPGPELCVFPDTTHFFHGKLIRLREVVMAFVDQHEHQP